MKTVFFVRHGETEYNQEKRLQGWCDSPLSDRGKQQVHQLAKTIAQLDIQHAFVSPLGRAQQTVEIIQSYLDFTKENLPELREVSFGDFEGNTLPELDIKFPGMWEARMDDKWSYRPPGGEANKDALPRAHEVIKRIEAFNSDRALLIVAHFAINRIILSLLAGIEPEETVRINVPHSIIYRAQQLNGEWQISHIDTTQPNPQFQPDWLLQHIPENLPTGG